MLVLLTLGEYHNTLGLNRMSWLVGAKCIFQDNNTQNGCGTDTDEDIDWMEEESPNDEEGEYYNEEDDDDENPQDAEAGDDTRLARASRQIPRFWENNTMQPRNEMHRGEGGSHSINSLYCIALFD